MNISVFKLCQFYYRLVYDVRGIPLQVYNLSVQVHRKVSNKLLNYSYTELTLEARTNLEVSVGST